MREEDEEVEAKDRGREEGIVRQARRSKLKGKVVGLAMDKCDAREGGTEGERQTEEEKETDRLTGR